MKRSFSTLIAFLFFTLMFFKVSSFHVYTHHDSDSNDIENCELCELAIENQNTDFLLDASFTAVEHNFEILKFNQPVTYDLVVTSSFLRFNFFGRPPPSEVA